MGSVVSAALYRSASRYLGSVIVIYRALGEARVILHSCVSLTIDPREAFRVGSPLATVSVNGLYATISSPDALPRPGCILFNMLDTAAPALYCRVRVFLRIQPTRKGPKW